MNSVALGSNSVANQANTVSVGDTGSERRITNVADGTGATDAVNRGQLDNVQTEVTNNVGDISTNTTDISTNTGSITTNASNIATNTSDIAANASAIANSAANMSYISTGSSGASSATGTGSIAIGSGASARTNDIAIGLNSNVTADGSTALGTNTTIASTNSVAVGADATVENGAPGGAAIGQNARVQTGAANGVALGKDSVASETNTVSVGSTTNQRRITNVANGIHATDAVNVQQLQQAMGTLNSDIDKLDDRVDDVGSLASAFSALVPNNRVSGNTQISVGMGHYSGSNAMAAGVFHYVSDKVLVNAAISSTFESTGTAGRAGVTFSF